MKLSLPRTPRAALRACLLAAAALVAACGGGDQSTLFSASRVIAFGDESSVLTGDGKKYTVNAFASGSSTAIDCTSNPIWVQTVAANFGLTFPQCPSATPGALPSTSRIRAGVGAKVADLAGQIDAQIADGGIRGGDLATLLVGVNDVIAQFERSPAASEADLLAAMDAAGAVLAGQANRLAGLDARVLISTIPDVGLMPYSGDRSSGSTNPNPVLLSRMSARFNDSMLAALLNDGRKIGLVQLDQYLNVVDRSARVGQSTYLNTVQGACTVALPDCTTGTVVAGSTTSWLWADDRRLGARGQGDLGSLAVSRINTNPF